MTRSSLRRGLLAILVLIAGIIVVHFAVRPRPVAAQPAPAPVVPVVPAVRDGWWIRINTNQTEATSIDFQIGTKAQDRETWRTWRSSDAVEFDVPAKYRTVNRIYIRATANPEGRKAWFCLMYGNKGIKHFDTNNWEQEDESQNDSDNDCK